MDTNVIITAIMGIIASIISSWASWFFARRKYNSEVDNSLILNMKESLEFYKQLSDDNRVRLEEVLKRNEYLEVELNDVKKQMFNLMSSICVDITCQLRNRDLTLFTNESTSKKKI